MAKDLKITVLLDFYGEMLTEKQRALITYYYNDDLSLAEIAEGEGITRQGVRDAIKRAEELLFAMEDKLHFVRRSLEAREVMQKIRDASEEISEYNLRYGSISEISERSRMICDLAANFSFV